MVQAPMPFPSAEPRAGFYLVIQHPPWTSLDDIKKEDGGACVRYLLPELQVQQKGDSLFWC